MANISLISSQLDLNITSLFSSPPPSETCCDDAEAAIISEELFYQLKEVITIVSLVIAISGICTNAFSAATYFMVMGTSDAVSISFLSLAVLDFGFTGALFIQYIANMLNSMEKDLGKWLFHIDPFAVIMFSGNVAIIINTASTLTTAYLAIVRCLCIAMPIKFKNIFTRNKCVIALCAFIVFSVALQSPNLANMGIQYKFNERMNASRYILWLSTDRQGIKDAIRLIDFFIMSMVTEIIVVICVIIMTIKLRESVSFRRLQNVNKTGTCSLSVSEDPQSDVKPTSKTLTGKERNLVLQVVVISSVFIVCNLFRMIHSWVSMVDSDYELGGRKRYLYRIMSLSRTSFDCVKSSVNFYVYLIFNRRFREGCVPFKYFKLKK